MELASIPAAPPQQCMFSPAPEEAPCVLPRRTPVQALEDAGLVCNEYRVDGIDGLDLVLGTWRYRDAFLLRLATLPFFCHCCFQLRIFEVEPGSVRPATAGDGRSIFFGPGTHVFLGLHYSIGVPWRVAAAALIAHGTKAIVSVEQGFVGHATDRGDHIVLPAGLHQWDSPELTFQSSIGLSESVVRIGPCTLVTVEESWAAVTLDNGVRRVLLGGGSYLLNHRGWTFQAWLPMQMQTSRAGPARMKTATGIDLAVTFSVNWSVRDVHLAASMVAMPTSGLHTDALGPLREDVSLQVSSALTFQVGRVQATAKRVTWSGASIDKHGGEGDHQPHTPGHDAARNEAARMKLWDPAFLQQSVAEANKVCGRYGVEVWCVNMLSASTDASDHQSDHQSVKSSSKSSSGLSSASSVDVDMQGIEPPQRHRRKSLSLDDVDLLATLKEAQEGAVRKAFRKSHTMQGLEASADLLSEDEDVVPPMFEPLERRAATVPYKGNVGSFRRRALSVDETRRREHIGTAKQLTGRKAFSKFTVDVVSRLAEAAGSGSLSREASEEKIYEAITTTAREATCDQQRRALMMGWI